MVLIWDTVFFKEIYNNVLFISILFVLLYHKSIQQLARGCCRTMRLQKKQAQPFQASVSTLNLKLLVKFIHVIVLKILISLNLQASIEFQHWARQN